MVTAFKVEASFFDDYVDGGAASISGGVNSNLKSEHHEETKNDVPTLKRCHHEQSSTFACNSLESSNQPIKKEGGLSSTTNNPYSRARYTSYSEIETMCRGDTSIGYSYYAAPHANNIVAEPPAVKGYAEAAVTKRRRLENEAAVLRHGTFKNDCMNQAQFVSRTGFTWNTNQHGRQFYHSPLPSSAGGKKTKASSAPRQQKVGSTTPKATPKIGATSKRQVQQEQQKLLSALKTTSKNATAQDKSHHSVTYGQRGVTMRASTKWQVQYFYFGKSRYIGVFESKTRALVAYETIREILQNSGRKPLSEEEAKSNIDAAKKAVVDALGASSRKRKKGTSSSKRQKVKRVTNG